MPMIITSKSGNRVYAYDTDQNGCSVRWNDEAHEETNHAAALRRLARKLNYSSWITQRFTCLDRKRLNDLSRCAPDRTH